MRTIAQPTKTAAPLFILARMVLLFGLLSLGCAWTGIPTSTPGLPDLNSGLDNLQSYRLTLKLRFTGQVADQGQSETILIDALEEQAIIDGRAIRHFLLLTSGAAGLPGALEYYQLGGQNYALSSAQSSNPICQPADQPIKAGSILDLLPQAALQSLRSAQSEGQAEVINGLNSDRYRLNPVSSADGLNQVEGQVWVAQQGAFVTRAVGSMQGPLSLTGLNSSGVLGWEYQRSENNSLTELPVPEQCEHLNRIILLLPNNAQVISQNSQQMIFTSNSTASEMVNFFEEQLPAQGWNIDQAGGSDIAFHLNASREDQAIAITIASNDSGQTQVIIESR